MTEQEAIVVGSGPNGLAAAIELARNGWTVTVYEGAATPGGGSRTLPLMQQDHFHDVCAAAHPIGAASPYFAALPLDTVEWITPDVAVSHPLDGGRAVGVLRSLDDTAGLLGADAAAYRKLVEPVVGDFDRILESSLGPLQAAWRQPVTMGRFGSKAIRSITSLARRFESDAAKALLAGLGAHSIASLHAPATGGVALVLAAAGPCRWMAHRQRRVSNDHRCDGPDPREPRRQGRHQSLHRHA